MKTFILGAGASNGYDEGLPNELRPPLAKELKVLGKTKIKRKYKSFKEYTKNL